MHLGLPAGRYLTDRDEKYVIRHQNMSSQGLTGLAGPIATSEIVLRYALSALTKRTDFNFSRFLTFLINILFTFYAPVTIVRGIKICPCLSVCLSVRPFVTLYGIEFV